MLRIALIGAGRIGQVHAKAIAYHPDVELTLVCDPFGTGAADLANKYGCRSSKDSDEAFTAPDIDAVVIGSPTPLHVEHILKAARAGKPALCEKPVAMTTAAVEQLREGLKGLDPVVMMGFNRRFDPSFAKIHRLVEEGVIGSLEQLTIISRDPAAPPLEYVKVSGGLFKDMTIHDFDMARFFLGDIVEVHAIGQNFDPEIKAAGDIDGAIVVLKNAAGTVATIINNRHCATGYDQRLEASGSKGSLSAENLRATTVKVNTHEVSNAEEPYLDFFLQRYEDAYSLELSSFIETLHRGEKPTPNIEDGVAALQIAEAAEKSMRTGQPVFLKKELSI